MCFTPKKNVLIYNAVLRIQDSQVPTKAAVIYTYLTFFFIISEWVPVNSVWLIWHKDLSPNSRFPRLCRKNLNHSKMIKKYFHNSFPLAFCDNLCTSRFIFHLLKNMFCNVPFTWGQWIPVKVQISKEMLKCIANFLLDKKQRVF